MHRFLNHHQAIHYWYNKADTLVEKYFTYPLFHLCVSLVYQPDYAVVSCHISPASLS